MSFHKKETEKIELVARPVDDFDLEVREVDDQPLLNLLNTVLDQTVRLLLAHI